jgi:signal transduction histidine kinase/CheY-like chemotaxis protein
VKNADILANAPAARVDAIRSEQVRALYRNATAGLLASLAAGVMLVGLLLYFGDLPPWTLWTWLGLAVLQTAARIATFIAYQRAIARAPAGAALDWRLWARRFTAGCLASGLIWGLGALWLMDPGHFDRQLLVVLVICALCYGALTSFASWLPAVYAFLVPALIPVTVWAALQGDPQHLVFAALSAIWVPMVAVLARNHGRATTESLALRYENLDLLADLQRQKDIAEQSNIAKSRFLASASHDLRQPVHALGMFVGALRAHGLKGPASRLLNHIESSVGALDNLFSALLDISRLDAGVIEVQVVAVRLDPILKRVCGDCQAEASQKGIRLTLVPSSTIVSTDPVLLERVVRNIVTNAVRYTERGRIVAGVRRKGGRARIEVWDTGPGIAASQRQDIFQEFFQVANPARDRSQGLGLGLAIVRRLTNMLDHPLALDSWPGRGSVFKVEVPLAQVEDLPAQETVAHVAAGPGLILVIDDEIAIQHAMSDLLQSWGHEVIAAGSGEEIIARIADCNRRPDLIICDYRLRGENGIAVIERLQSEFNDDIPAMLVTGDTAPDRLTEASESGLMLLHKPLPEARLRAAIGAMMPA